MSRRELIVGLGGATLWPLVALAQQPALPIVGFLNAQSAQDYRRQLAVFLDELAEAGYVDGRNVKIEYRWAENHSDRLPALMVDLLDRKPAVIAATSTPAALAAKAANTTTPIVFETAFDPIQLGLVKNLNRPGENITGVTQLNAFVTPKRLELLHELVPKADVVGLLVNPANPVLVNTETNGALSAAKSLGVTLHVFHASNEGDFEGVFAKLTEIGAGGLVIGADPLFTSRSARLGNSRRAAQCPQSSRIARSPRPAGSRAMVATSSILTGRPASTSAAFSRAKSPPTCRSSRAPSLNSSSTLKAAKELGIAVPLPLSGRADEVIE